jgi:FkbM family methyltransferase
MSDEIRATETIPSTGPVRRATLPNGLEIAYQGKAEMEQMYDDIFEKRVYTRQGITLRDGDCVFDVGGNIGLFTVFVALHWPGAHIWTFEPAPPLFQILSANAAPYGDRIRRFNCGLSSQPGEAELTFYPHTSGMSSFYPNEQEEREALRTLIHNEMARGKEGVEDLLQYEDELLAERFRRETLTCRLRTLSEVIREEGVTRIDLLKIDVEKSEIDVLAGLDEDDWPKLQQAVLEVHDLGDRLKEVNALFRSHGFTVTMDQDDLYHGSDRWNVYALRETLSRRPDRAAALGRIEDRARRLREAMRGKR